MSLIIIHLVIAYLCILNLIGFASMGIDKRKAIRGAWRIPEATLFFIALIGGSVGSIAGMYVFRHKTKHWNFVLGMPAILMVQLVLILFILFRKALL